MTCNKIIHNEIKDMGQIFCDFCDLKLADNIWKQDDSHCEKMNFFTSINFKVNK